MNGFADHGLDEDAFGEKSGNLVQAFDAFPKSKPQYLTRSSGGGKWTVAIMVISVLLSLTELARWWRGAEIHTFSVEKGIGHDLQINLDLVIAMRCEDIHINVQDAAGDRILAAEKLRLEATDWSAWVTIKGMHRLGKDDQGRVVTGEGYHDDEGFGEEHVHDIVAAAAASGKGWMGKNAKWSKTPRLKRGSFGDSCRVYGSLDVNKVQGDFHLTARGHGYQQVGQHLDHTAFNFSHIVSELSFGPFYPSLVNPLDKTIATTSYNFQRFQYFVSVVPTIYTLGRAIFPSSATSSLLPTSVKTIFTNQYAVTSQSQVVGEYMVPGIFFKYDIEPLLLTVEEHRESWMRFVIKLVNVVSGVLVAGHWGFTISESARSWLQKGKRRSDGVLHGRQDGDRED